MDKLKFSDETLEAYSNALTAFHASLPTTNEACRNWLRAFGHDVILIPDDQIIEITDAPAIELADGRKYREDGTVYDG